MRTADLLSRNVEKVLRSADVSPTQYNVLRILRGAPEGLPCSEIGKRMITRDPDITRLLDRLEKRDLVTRCREDQRSPHGSYPDQSRGVARVARVWMAQSLKCTRPNWATSARKASRFLMELLARAREKAA